MKRSRGPKRRYKPKEYDAALAEAWFRAIIPRRAVCAVCGSGRALQAHHVLDKQYIEQFVSAAGLNNEQRNRLLWDVRNGIALCVPCHERHSKVFRRVPRAKLPLRAWRFARTLDRAASLLCVRAYGPGWATDRLIRDYPVSP